MWNSIKHFLYFLNWGWFAVVVGLAAVLVALFPFNVISFEYSTSPPVLAVMMKTILIAIPTVPNVGLAAYFIYHKDLWRKNAAGAIAIHVLWGMLLSFIIVSWMIRLLYSDSIGLDPNHQTDIVFAGSLLLLLNFWMRVRIEIALRRDSDIASLAQAEGHTQLIQEKLQQDVALQHLAEGKEVLQKLVDTQKEEIAQLKIGLASSVPSDKIKESKHLEIKSVHGIVILTQNDVLRAEAKKVARGYTYEVVGLNGEIYYAPVQSLRVLVTDYFTEMMLVSRTHAVMPKAMVRYDELEDDKLLLYVLHSDVPIEVSGVYFKRNKEQIIKLIHDR